MEKEIIKLIAHKGPLTGSEIWETFGGDGIILWQICRGNQRIPRSLGVAPQAMESAPSISLRRSPGKKKTSQGKKEGTTLCKYVTYVSSQ